LTAEIVETGPWQIEIAGVRYAATASLKPLYDPGMTKIKC
jgi:4-methylaminobutanoate oxidase (formaldehyde-forming)